MSRPIRHTALALMALVTGLAVCASVRAEEKTDTQIGVLAGEWQIDYTHDAVRTYVVEKDGQVAGTAGEEKLKGRITRKDGVLLLIFDGDGKLERLTLGSDGRLFVEHYGNADDYPAKKAKLIGVGVRQK
jgi:hypothetical protein